VLQAGLTQALSVAFTPDDTLHYSNATKTSTSMSRSILAPLVLVGAPDSAANGTTFTLSTTGGSGTGAQPRRDRRVQQYGRWRADHHDERQWHLLDHGDESVG
jgi:hypothetical protein